MTTTDEILAHIVHLIDLPLDHHIDLILVLVIDHALFGDKSLQEYDSFRPFSRPKDFRHGMSRSYSEHRNKVTSIQTKTSKTPIKFGIHVYPPTQMPSHPNHSFILTIYKPPKHTKNVIILQDWNSPQYSTVVYPFLSLGIPHILQLQNFAK